MRSQIRLSFNTLEDGAILSFPTPDGTRKFNCEELKAILTDTGSEIVLLGNIDCRVPYKGIIQSNSLSKLNVLRYLSYTLARKNHQGPSEEYSRMMGFITDEISQIVLSSAQAGVAISDTSEIFAPDLRWGRVRKKSRSSTSRKDKSKLKKMILFSSLSKQELSKLPYGALSGFINLEIQGDEETYDKSLWEQEGIEFLGLKLNPERGILARVELRLSDSLRPESLFFFHVLDANTGEWIDVEGRTLKSADGSNTFEVELPNSKEFASGKLPLSFFVQGRYESKKIWMTKPGELYYARVSGGIVKANTSDKKSHSDNKNLLQSFESISRWCANLLRKGPIDSSEIFSDPAFGERFMHAYQEALRRLAKRPSKNANSIIRAVRTLGVNHVYMVSPEGPNAIAGGLAQVIKGLSMRLSSEGIPVTIISPLYDKSVGSNNLGAESIIENGFNFLGESVRLEEVGNVLVPFGRLRNGVEETAEVGRFYRSQVYRATVGKINFIFLRHKKLADRLYGGISGRDLLERGIFLSKGSLEIISSSKNLVKRGILLSNDWLGALIAPYLKFDGSYSEFNELRAMHVLHNAGRGYQARINCKENGQDLWGLLGLPEDVRSEFLEDGSENIINLTQASIRASSCGTLTVSRPYAEQLLTEEHGEGLNKILSEKEIFGISNGISEVLVRESAFGDYFSEFSNIDTSEICKIKKTLLLEAQESLGLAKNKDAILAVMIGRLTEQKGIGLISPEGNERSVFEVMLSRYPKLQIAVVGPGSEKEEEFIKFKKQVDLLKSKFPGRVSSRYEFVDPGQAIRFTAGASMFLMPSRYEPGGLTQLEAMCVGTSVVAHRVGGLSATLSQYSELSGSSFLFEDFSRTAFLRAFNEAVQCFLDKEIRELIIDRALKTRNDWSHRIPYYLTLFQEVLGVFHGNSKLEESDFYKTIKSLTNRIRARKY